MSAPQSDAPHGEEIELEEGDDAILDRIWDQIGAEGQPATPPDMNTAIRSRARRMPAGAIKPPRSRQ